MMCVDITPPFLDFVINYSVIMYYVCIACILNIIKIIRLLLYCYFDCSTNAESHCHEVNKYFELSFWFSKFRERTNWKKRIISIVLNWIEDDFYHGIEESGIKTGKSWFAAKCLTIVGFNGRNIHVRVWFAFNRS